VESAGVCGHFAGGVGARGGGDDDGNARRRALSHIALTEQLRQFTAREVARAGVRGSRKREVTMPWSGRDG
jgi:Mg-chelatase subunit ChlI